MYSVFFALCIILLLISVYWQTTREMTKRVDLTINLEKDNFLNIPSSHLPSRVESNIRNDLRHIYIFSFFNKDGSWLAGNLKHIPSSLSIDGNIHQLIFSPYENTTTPIVIRIMAVRIKSGETFIIGRDVSELIEFHQMIKNTFLLWGAFIIISGFGIGLSLSVRPFNRIREIQRVCKLIMQGDFKQRLPITSSRDEIEMLTSIINTMLDSVERLMSEVKSVSDNIAHDLRTPLTRLRAFIYRSQQEQSKDNKNLMLEKALFEIDSMLSRFRALLRISEIENGKRRACFKTFNLSSLLKQATTFFEPVADEKSITLTLELCDSQKYLVGDEELLFEAIANLLDNAIKFTPAGGFIKVTLKSTAHGPTIHISDTGIGIEEEERNAVCSRFYRSQNNDASGHGLGLSIVTAVMQLHDFEFKLEDDNGGTCAIICCWSATLDRFIECD